MQDDDATEPDATEPDATEPDATEPDATEAADPAAAGADAGPAAALAVDDTEIERLRAENARLSAQVDAATSERRARRGARGRGVLSISLVVLGALLLPLAATTVWTRNQVLDTNKYLETVGPLGKDPAVIAALTTRISDAVSAEIDVKSLAEEALPEKAAFLAAPIAAGADTLVQTATSKLLKSKEFAALWIEANRTAHEGLVAVLTGRKGPVVSTENGRVVISLGPLVQRVLDRLDQQFGVNLSSRVPADKINIKYTIIDSAELAKIQTQVRWFDKLSWFSLFLAAACFVGAVFAATERRKGLLRVGIGITVSMLVALLAMSIGRGEYLSNLPRQVQSSTAAAVVFDTLTRYLLQAFRVLFVLGVVILFAAWVAGPARAATWIRTLWNRVLGRGSSGIGGTVELGPVPGFFAAHLGAIRVVIAALAAVLLVTWTKPTGKVVLLVAFIALVLLAITQLLAGVAATNTPDTPDTTDTAGGTEDDTGTDATPDGDDATHGSDDADADGALVE